ncbi:hypothetical protein [Synechococcus sp. WH 7805]|nr:hypothetical protein [Synechococcus sp. WH 7805]
MAQSTGSQQQPVHPRPVKTAMVSYQLPRLNLPHHRLLQISQIRLKS